MIRRVVKPEFGDGQRVLLSCRRSSMAAVPNGPQERKTAAQEDQLRSWLAQHTTVRLHVTVVRCTMAGDRASLPNPAALQRNGISVILIASLDRVARGEAGQEWLKLAARAGLRVIVANGTTSPRG